MVSREKVAIMTRLAIEEKHDSRSAFVTGSFWFTDYASKELWESFFAISFAYAAVVLLGLVAFGDVWTVTYHLKDLESLAFRLINIYLAVVSVGMLIGLLAHVGLYRDAYRKRQAYREDLKKLARLYQAEEALKEASGRQEKQK